MSPVSHNNLDHGCKREVSCKADIVSIPQIRKQTQRS